jgi:hypothetical protein
MADGLGEAFIAPCDMALPCDIIACDDGFGEGEAGPIASARAIVVVLRAITKLSAAVRAFKTSSRDDDFLEVRRTAACG